MGLDNECLIKDNRQKTAFQERLFISLCSEKDADRIKLSGNLDVQNYERLCCIMDALGLKELLENFICRNIILEQQLDTLIEQQFINRIDNSFFEKAIEEERSWLLEFSANQKSESVKYYLRELFELY